MSTPATVTRQAVRGDWPLIDAFHQRRCSTENLRQRWGRTSIQHRDWARLLALATCWITTPTGSSEVIALSCLGPVAGQPGVMDLGLQVADAWQRHGLGAALAYRAASHALATGAHMLTAYTQATNTGMLTVLRRLGPTTERRERGDVDVRLPLHQLAALHPHAALREVFV